MPTRLICNFSTPNSLPCYRFTIFRTHYISRSPYLSDASSRHITDIEINNQPNRHRQLLPTIAQLTLVKKINLQSQSQFNHHTTVERTTVARRALLPRSPVLHCVCSRGAKVCKCLNHHHPRICSESDQHQQLPHENNNNMLHHTTTTGTARHRVPKQIITNYGFARSNLLCPVAPVLTFPATCN